MSAVLGQSPHSHSQMPHDQLCAPFTQLEQALRSTIRANAADIQHLISTGMFHPGLYRLGFPRCIDYVLLPMLLMLPSSSPLSSSSPMSEGPLLPQRVHEALWRCICALLHAAGPEAFCREPTPGPAAAAVGVPARVEDVLWRALYSIQQGQGQGQEGAHEHTIQAALAVFESVCAHAAGLPLPSGESTGEGEGEELGVGDSGRKQWKALQACAYGTHGWHAQRGMPYASSIPPPLSSLPALADCITTLLSIAAAVPPAKGGPGGTRPGQGFGGHSMTAAGALPDPRASHALYGRETRLAALSTLCAVLCAVGRPPLRTTAAGGMEQQEEEEDGSGLALAPGPHALAPILPGCVTSLLALAAPASITTGWARDAAVRTASVHSLALLLTLALGGSHKATAPSPSWLETTAEKVYTALTVLARHTLSLALYPLEHRGELAAHASLYSACAQACKHALASTPAHMLCAGMALLACVDAQEASLASVPAVGVVPSDDGPSSIDLCALYAALLPTLAKASQRNSRLTDACWLSGQLPALKACPFILSLPPSSLVSLARASLQQQHAGGGTGQASVLVRAAGLWAQAQHPDEGKMEGTADSCCTPYLAACAACAQALPVPHTTMEQEEEEDEGGQGYHAAFTRLRAAGSPHCNTQHRLGQGGKEAAAVDLLLIDHAAVGRMTSRDIGGVEACSGDAGVAQEGQAMEAGTVSTLYATLSVLLGQHERSVLAEGEGEGDDAEREAEARFLGSQLSAGAPLYSAAAAARSGGPVPPLLLALLASSTVAATPALLHITALAVQAYAAVYREAVAALLSARGGSVSSPSSPQPTRHPLPALKRRAAHMGSCLGKWAKEGVHLCTRVLQAEAVDEEDTGSVECCRLLCTLGSVCGRAFQPFLPSLLPVLLSRAMRGSGERSRGGGAQAALTCMSYLQPMVTGGVGSKGADRVHEACIRLLGLPLPLQAASPPSLPPHSGMIPGKEESGLERQQLVLWRGVLPLDVASPYGASAIAVSRAAAQAQVQAGKAGQATGGSWPVALATSNQGALALVPAQAMSLLASHVDVLADHAVRLLRGLVEGSISSPALLPWGKGLLLQGEEGYEEAAAGAWSGLSVESYRQLPGLLSTVVTAALQHDRRLLATPTHNLSSATARGPALPLLRDVATALLQAMDAVPGMGEVGTGRDSSRAAAAAGGVMSRSSALAALLDGAAQVVAAVAAVGAAGGQAATHFRISVANSPLLARESARRGAGPDGGGVDAVWARARLLAGARVREQSTTAGGDAGYSRKQTEQTDHPFVQSTEAGLSLLPVLSPAALVVAVRMARAAAAHLTTCAVDFSRDDGAATEARGSDTHALHSRMSRLRVTLAALRTFMVCCTALALHPDTLHPLVADTLPSLLALLPPPGAVRLLPGPLAALRPHSLSATLEGTAAGATAEHGHGHGGGGKGVVSTAALLPAALPVPLPGSAAAAAKEQSVLDQARSFMRRRAAALRGMPVPVPGVGGGQGGDRARGKGGGEAGLLALTRPAADPGASEGVDSMTALVHATALDALCLLVRAPSCPSGQRDGEEEEEGEHQGGDAQVRPGAVCAEIVRAKFTSDVWPRLRAVLLAAALELRGTGGTGGGTGGGSPPRLHGPRLALYASALRTVLACAQPSVTLARTADVDAGSAAQDAAGRSSDPLSDRGPVIPGHKGGLAAPGPASATTSLLKPPALGARVGASGEEGEGGESRGIGGSGRRGALDPHTVVPYGSDQAGQVHVGSQEGEDRVLEVTLEPPILRLHAWEVSVLCSFVQSARGGGGGGELQGLARQALQAVRQYTDPAAVWAAQARVK